MGQFQRAKRPVCTAVVFYNLKPNTKNKNRTKHFFSLPMKLVKFRFLILDFRAFPYLVSPYLADLICLCLPISMLCSKQSSFALFSEQATFIPGFGALCILTKPGISLLMLSVLQLLSFKGQVTIIHSMNYHLTTLDDLNNDPF